VSLFFSPPLLHANNSFNEREYRYVAEQVWTFERSFDVAPATLAETAVELVLTGLDTVADVLLNGEKIDIVRWEDDIVAYATNALSPAKLREIKVDEKRKRLDIIVDKDQLSLAIGKKGQNARLTAKLTGWKIDIRKEGSIVDKLKEAFLEAKEIILNLDRYKGNEFYSFGHIGAPTIHAYAFIPSKDISNDIKKAVTLEVREKTERLNVKYGGCGGEWGITAQRSSFLKEKYGQGYYDFLVRLKKTFDPNNILMSWTIIMCLI